MNTSSVTYKLCVGLFCCALLVPLQAADTPSNMGDSPLDEARQAITAKDWRGALERLHAAELQQAEWNNSADFHNLMGFVLRNLPHPNMELVFRHYERALAIDPGHRQAREYLGEAWLMVGRRDKALEQLKAIEHLCGNTSCEEWKDLYEATERHQR